MGGQSEGQQENIKYTPAQSGHVYCVSSDDRKKCPQLTAASCLVTPDQMSQGLYKYQLARGEGSQS